MLLDFSFLFSLFLAKTAMQLARQKYKIATSKKKRKKLLDQLLLTLEQKFSNRQ